MKRGPWVIAAWWAIFSLWWGEARRDGRRLSVTSQPKCGSGGCGKRPVFGDPLVKIACRCAQHKLPGYENLFGFQCEGEGCNKSAYFGSLEDGVRRFCGQHRGFGQSNLMSRSCLDPTGCVKRACYGNDADRIPLFCAKHKHVFHVDVVNRRCSFTGCSRCVFDVLRLYPSPSSPSFTPDITCAPSSSQTECFPMAGAAPTEIQSAAGRCFAPSTNDLT